MLVVCCVCKRIISTKEPLEDKSESHTYCDTCLTKTPIGQLVAGGPVYQQDEEED